MKQTLVDRLSSFFEKNPTLKGKPATEEQITGAEKALGVKMDEDYKTFIRHFGGAYAGIAVHAFANGSSVGNETVEELTDRGRKLFNEADLFPEINDSIVIADDGSGNPIAIEPNGEVVLFDYDTEEKQILSASFEQFIEDNFSEW